VVERDRMLEISRMVRHVAFLKKGGAPARQHLSAQSLRSVILRYPDAQGMGWRKTLHLLFTRQNHIRTLAVNNIK